MPFVALMTGLPTESVMSSHAITSIYPGRNCGACGATNNSVIHKQRFVVPEGYPLPTEYSIVRCDVCGFVYANASASQENYNHVYSQWSKYDDAATSTGSDLSKQDANRWSVLAAALASRWP